MLKTLAEAKASQILDVVGACSNSTKFLGKLNAATERLMNRGDWVGTVQPINVCVRGGWVVWPRYVGKIRRINNCCGPMPVRDMGWDFLEKPTYESYCGQGMSLTNWGKSPIYNDVPVGDRLIRVYINAAIDVGKTITLFGLDSGGQALRTLNIDGTYSDGLTIAAAKPFASTAIYVRSISRVIKQPTEGKMWMAAYNPVSNLMVDLAFYEPSETNPDYTKTWLVGCCATVKSVVALVKLKFIPVVHDTDLVLIQNLHALKLMIQAGDFESANNRDLARQYEADAIRELNCELEDETPDHQIPVVINTFGGTDIGRQHVY
jgi:hypothetical protein